MYNREQPQHIDRITFAAVSDIFGVMCNSQIRVDLFVYFFALQLYEDNGLFNYIHVISFAAYLLLKSSQIRC